MSEHEDDWRTRAQLFDKQIKATANLVNAGMKMIARKGRETDFRIRALIDAQQRSEATFDRHQAAFEQHRAEAKKTMPIGRPRSRSSGG